ncbi:MAG: dihydropteroate synthase [Deltaproteobacteria bacterium HGW-Deltaproteobacteria-19]|jgi:dihydropteroate synthase|nr:MAG: dihydropteroate synthase [Deltaproteobacteria bacterium HGW-Deltaproteobacteria-19]
MHPRVLHCPTTADARDILRRVGSDPWGVEAMLPKMTGLAVLLEKMPCRDANILKQEMLSVGGDAAVARGTVACSLLSTDVVLMGTVKQLRRFAAKMAFQPFGLKALAEGIPALLERHFRDRYVLKAGTWEMTLGERTLVMGILNVTPDSFSDGGRCLEPDAAVARALEMIDEGADLVDVGGESTRPGSEPVVLKEELRRVIPVIEALARQLPVPLSVDTAKAEVARRAVAAGAAVVNDVSAMTFDRDMAGVVAETGAAVSLMHIRGVPRDMQSAYVPYDSVPGDMIDFLRGRMVAAAAAGIPEERILVDPGFGFGKSDRDNWRILHHLEEFRSLGRPVLVGVSRKASIGRMTGDPPTERLPGTAAAVTAAILNGAAMIRVHDVKAMKKVAAVADAIRRGDAGNEPEGRP